jgi:hypothetical protein
VQGATTGELLPSASVKERPSWGDGVREKRKGAGLPGNAVFLMYEAMNTYWAAVFVVFCLESDHGHCRKYLP